MNDAGGSVGSRPWTVGPITRTDIVRFQGASGDLNPIHHDDQCAVAAGFPTAFAPGMLPAGLMASYAVRWLGVAGLRSYTARFRGQVWPGDVLTISGQVEDLEPSDEGQLAHATFSCANQRGEVVLTARGQFVLGTDSGLSADHARSADGSPSAPGQEEAR